MIYINGRFLTQPMTGVERYAYNICKALRDLQQPFTVVCPKAQSILPCYDVSGFQIVRYGIGSSHFWEQCILPFFFIGKKDYTLFNFTGLGTILVRQKVMIIHDLSFLHNPKWFSASYYWWYRVMMPLAARSSRHIITISEFSKREILKYYPFLDENRVSVIYGAADDTLFQPHANEEPSSVRYALAVSSLDPRKNFESLIKAFEGLNDCQLYIVGSANRVFSQRNNLQQHSNIKFLGRVSDDELVRLYRQAACFIFPSVYEGFGLPPLEAMCCGCPVLVSDIPVLREVCQDAAIYFNPLDINDIHTAIEHFLSLKDTERAAMQERGLAHAAHFSWEQAAKAIVALS